MKRLFLLLQLIPLGLCAQNNWFCSDSSFCSSGVSNKSKNRGILLSFDQLPSIKLESKGENDETIATIDDSRRIRFKMKIPILNKESVKILMGFKYSNENINFNSRADETEQLFNFLNDKKFKSAGMDLYVLKPFRGNAYMTIGFGLGIHGDFNGFLNTENRFVNYKGGFLIGRMKSKYVEYGFGLLYSKKYGFGAWPIPIIKYDHTFSKSFGIEMMLPYQMYYRFNISEANMLKLGIKGGNTSYNIGLKELQGFENSSLRFSRTFIRYGLTFDQQLFHPIWLSLSAGYQQNVSFNIRESFSDKGDYLLNTEPGGSPYFNFSIFMTNPKKKS